MLNRYETARLARTIAALVLVSFPVYMIALAAVAL